jgi:microcystin degradation protein MlrC
MTGKSLIESFFHCRRCVLEDADPNIAAGFTGDGTHLQVWCENHQVELGMFALKDPIAPMACEECGSEHH